MNYPPIVRVRNSFRKNIILWPDWLYIKEWKFQKFAWKLNPNDSSYHCRPVGAEIGADQLSGET